MPRGRRRKPAPQLPPKGFYQADVSVAEMVRDGHISLAEGWMLNLLAMFDWRGTGAADVTIRELARWLGVSREHAQRMFAHLRDLGLVDRGEDGRICVIYKSRDIATSLPIPLYGGGGIGLDNREGNARLGSTRATRARGEYLPPPPPDLTHTPDSCDAQITQFPNHVISASQELGEEAVAGEENAIPPPIAAVCAHIGVESARGRRALARLGVGPRALLAWHRERSKRGSEVGSMVNMADEEPEQARQRIRAVLNSQDIRVWRGLDFCPRCGASWRTLYRVPRVCKECDARLRVCRECGELALVEEPCPYCGAPDEPQEPSRPDEGGDEEVREGEDDVSPAKPRGEEAGTPLMVVRDVLRQGVGWAGGLERRLYEQAVRDAEVLEFLDGYVIVVPSATAQSYLAVRPELRERLEALKGEDVVIKVVVRGSREHRAFVEALKEDGEKNTSGV